VQHLSKHRLGDQLHTAGDATAVAAAAFDLRSPSSYATLLLLLLLLLLLRRRRGAVATGGARRDFILGGPPARDARSNLRCGARSIRNRAWRWCCCSCSCRGHRHNPSSIINRRHSKLLCTLRRRRRGRHRRGTGVRGISSVACIRRAVAAIATTGAVVAAVRNRMACLAHRFATLLRARVRVRNCVRVGRRRCACTRGGTAGSSRRDRGNGFFQRRCLRSERSSTITTATVGRRLWTVIIRAGNCVRRSSWIGQYYRSSRNSSSSCRGHRRRV
jgi:hypothetical protein